VASKSRDGEARKEAQGSWEEVGTPSERWRKGCYVHKSRSVMSGRQGRISLGRGKPAWPQEVTSEGAAGHSGEKAGDEAGTQMEDYLFELQTEGGRFIKQQRSRGRVQSHRNRDRVSRKRTEGNKGKSPIL